MHNILFTNVGRRGTLMNNMKESFGENGRIFATDNWSVAPALFLADKYFLTPKITEEGYIEKLFQIVSDNKINAITTLIDPEINLLSNNREAFISRGVLPLCPNQYTAELCFDKFKMYKFLVENGIRTTLTFDSIDNFYMAYKEKKIDFPVFIKPRTGSGSVGARKVNALEELEVLISSNNFDYIIQEYMDCMDCDVDAYIDTVSHKLVAAFSKKKIETRIGGASKTISFKDSRLFEFVEKIVDVFEFNGPVDMDFFYKDGEYYLSEINPRFGGAYLHAYGSGVDFGKYIINNIDGNVNVSEIGNYDEDTIMLMYDAVVMTNVKNLKGDYRD